MEKLYKQSAVGALPYSLSHCTLSVISHLVILSVLKDVLIIILFCSIYLCHKGPYVSMLITDQNIFILKHLMIPVVRFLMVLCRPCHLQFPYSPHIVSWFLTHLLHISHKRLLRTCCREHSLLSLPSDVFATKSLQTFRTVDKWTSLILTHINIKQGITIRGNSLCVYCGASIPRF